MSNHESSPVIVTLFEGDYHLGVGALVNSLYHHGFRGCIYAGYRGSLPPWVTCITKVGEFEEFQVADGCRIRFHNISRDIHFANYKAAFLLETLERLENKPESIFYFDPDIVIKCRWSFFAEDWLSGSVCACQEIVMNPLPESHPFRNAWKAFASQMGYPFLRVISGYINSGFVGFSKSSTECIRLWDETVRSLESKGHSLHQFEYRDLTNPFKALDQDALYIALSACESEVNLIGPEGMDFSGGGFTMSHAVGPGKPWRKRFIRESLSGCPPTLADKGWLKHSLEPIPVLTSRAIMLKSLQCKIASAIGRYVRRS